MSDDSKFNLNALTFSKPKAYGSTGAKVINVNDATTRSPVSIVTPLIFTYGAQQVTEVKNDVKVPIPNKFTMALQFPDDDRNTPELQQFRESMQGFYDKVKAEALLRSDEWFGRDKISIDAVDEIFNPMLRYPNIPGTERKDLSRPPTLPVKIPFWQKTGKWPTQVFDSKCTPLYVSETCPGQTPVEHLQGNMNVICLITCGGIWFAAKKMSIVWNVTEVVVDRASHAAPRGQCSLRERVQPGYSESDQYATAQAEYTHSPSSATTPVVAQAAHIVDDSDDDDDDDDDLDAVKNDIAKATPVPVVAPAPVPVVPVVVAPVVPAPVPIAVPVVPDATTPAPAVAPKRRVRKAVAE